MKTDSNVYTITYATILVVIVAVLLAVVSQGLKSRQEANARLDVQKQILTALNVDYDNANPAKLYDEIVEETTAGEMPLYIAKVEGQTKYVLKLKGQGLWGGIWGFVALDADKNTIYGINFGHEGETPGLGAEITTENFRSRFFGKHIKDAEGNLRSVAVIKAGKQAEEGQEQVDAWAGATITSTGVNDMLLNSLSAYAEFLDTKNSLEDGSEATYSLEVRDNGKEIENAE